MNKLLKQGIKVELTLPQSMVNEANYNAADWHTDERPEKKVTIEYVEMQSVYFVQTSEITQKFINFAEVERFVSGYIETCGK